MLKYIIFSSFVMMTLYAKEQFYVANTKQNIVWQDNTQRDELKWKLAKGYCKQLHLDGFSDWRLPTKKELINLAKSPVMKKKFSFLDDEVYWSADSDTNDNLNAHAIYMGNGFVSSSDKCDKNFYICVRNTEK